MGMLQVSQNGTYIQLTSINKRYFHFFTFHALTKWHSSLICIYLRQYSTSSYRKGLNTKLISLVTGLCCFQHINQK